MPYSDDRNVVTQATHAPPVEQSSSLARSTLSEEVPYDGTIRLVGHRLRDVVDGLVQVEAQIICEGRTFSGAAAGRAALPERLRVPALATLRALDSCLEVFYMGESHPALVLDHVLEVSVGDTPLAVVMVTASEKPNPTSLVASCPLVGMPDLAIILATLQATTRTVSRWLAWGDRSPREQQMRPQ